MSGAPPPPPFLFKHGEYREISFRAGQDAAGQAGGMFGHVGHIQARFRLVGGWLAVGPVLTRRRGEGDVGLLGCDFPAIHAAGLSCEAFRRLRFLRNFRIIFLCISGWLRVALGGALGIRCKGGCLGWAMMCKFLR